MGAGEKRGNERGREGEKARGRRKTRERKTSRGVKGKQSQQEEGNWSLRSGEGPF